MLHAWKSLTLEIPVKIENFDNYYVNTLMIAFLDLFLTNEVPAKAEIIPINYYMHLVILSELSAWVKKRKRKSILVKDIKPSI